MHTVERPGNEPQELARLRQDRTDDFGSLNHSLDRVFGGVCAYCEREPLWRAPEDGLGAQDSDLTDEEGVLFTCDHFRPRHLFPDLIYDWNNLVYACQACNSVKGGQWPGDADEADSYIDPCAEPSSGVDPNSVFEYRLETGEIEARAGITGVIKANAQKTIDDLALNRFTTQREAILRDAKVRRVHLPTYRQQRAKRVEETLDNVAAITPHLLPVVVSSVVSPRARFASICRQQVEQAGYGRYLI